MERRSLRQDNSTNTCNRMSEEDASNFILSFFDFFHEGGDTGLACFSSTDILFLFYIYIYIDSFYIIY